MPESLISRFALKRFVPESFFGNKPFVLFQKTHSARKDSSSHSDSLFIVLK